MKGVLIYLFSLLFSIPLVAQPGGSDLKILNNIPSNVQNAMEYLFSSAERGDKVLLEHSVNDILRFKLQGMYDNTVPLATQVRAGLKKAKKINITSRIALLRKTIEMAPVLPQTRMDLAFAYISQGSGNTPAAVSSFVDGLSNFFTYLPGLFVFLGNLAFYLGQGIALTVILFAISLFLRKMPLLGHDLVDLLPGLRINVLDVWDPHEHHIRMVQHADRLGKWLVLVVAFIPLAIGLGLLPAALVWIIVLGLYTSGKELKSAIFIVILASMVPLFALQVGASSTLQHSLGEALYNCGTDMCSKTDISIITQSEDDGENIKLKYLALSLQKLHKAVFLNEDLDDAREFAMKIPKSAAKFTVLGNIASLNAFRKCRTVTDKRGIPDNRFLETANLLYKQAISMAPNDPAPLYGMSLISTYNYDRRNLDNVYRKLVNLTPEDDLNRVAKMREDLNEKDFCKHRELVGSILHNPKYPWNKAYIGNLTFMDAPMIFPFSTLLVGNLPKSLILIMGPLALILLILVSVVGKRLSLAKACPKCSTVSCSKCNVATTGFDYCSTCLLSQVRGGMIGQEQAFILRRKSDTKKRRQIIFHFISSLIIPGTGQVAEGRTVTGIIFLLAVSILFFWVAYPWPPFVDLRTFVGFDTIEPSLLQPILLIIVYGISWVDAWHRMTR